ncbi:hypothetical protein DW996_12495 [Roseburia sp. AM51-8]|uniref:tyrosine-type recombinase/integrase n=1 Tax=Roseburia sp. AM51-8 TaxID=2292366 RepID=UPI000E5134E7|nr:tyrosine-type recombinase/integrase [Roseburia sp. AM51-8]RHP98990.1 hypothetical protein DW996_12495 [Roseburia sp. AM51-8]
MEAKTVIINKVIMEMERILSQDQLDMLHNVLMITLYDCEISEGKNEIVEYDDYDRFLCEQYYATLKVEGKSEKTKEPALTSGQIEKAMINCKSTRDKAIISFMYETGARVSEVAGVQLSDIDFNEHTVLLHGKGGKDRISMFTDKSAMYLEEYLTNRDLSVNALFESKNKGSALSAAGIRSMIHDVGVRSGITRLHPHRFRVSRITHLVDRGMPLQDVQELAGHTSINTTRSYYRNTLENVKHSYLKAAQ